MNYPQCLTTQKEKDIFDDIMKSAPFLTDSDHYAVAQLSLLIVTNMKLKGQMTKPTLTVAGERGTKKDIKNYAISSYQTNASLINNMMKELGLTVIHREKNLPQKEEKELDEYEQMLERNKKK